MLAWSREDKCHLYKRLTEHKVSVAAFTSRDEKWVGEERGEDTTEENGREKGSVGFI